MATLILLSMYNVHHVATQDPVFPLHNVFHHAATQDPGHCTKFVTLPSPVLLY